VHAPGYVRDRGELARWLASADLYVSGMADESFGISIIEAQASGLPVVGIAEGAMLDRVPDSLGRTGPIGDSKAMAANIRAVWNGDHLAMGERARAHVAQFSWDQSMERLFGTVYVRARATAAARRAGTLIEPAGRFAEA
jgi:alpha-1,6-mannosyltransferase